MNEKRIGKDPPPVIIESLLEKLAVSLNDSTSHESRKIIRNLIEKADQNFLLFKTSEKMRFFQNIIPFKGPVRTNEFIKFMNSFFNKINEKIFEIIKNAINIAEIEKLVENSVKSDYLRQVIRDFIEEIKNHFSEEASRQFGMDNNSKIKSIRAIFGFEGRFYIDECKRYLIKYYREVTDPKKGILSDEEFFDILEETKKEIKLKKLAQLFIESEEVRKNFYDFVKELQNKSEELREIFQEIKEHIEDFKEIKIILRRFFKKIRERGPAFEEVQELELIFDEDLSPLFQIE